MVIEQTLHPHIPSGKVKESALTNKLSKFLQPLIECEKLDSPLVCKKAAHLKSLLAKQQPANLVAAANYQDNTALRPCLLVEERINDVRFINKFFESVNKFLPEGGFFIGCLQTATLRKKALKKRIGELASKAYHPVDYVVNRVIPKLSLTKKAYFSLTKGKNRVVTEMEAYGRLYSCGFTLVESFLVEGLLYFVAKKIKEPEYNRQASYGPLITLKRHGKNGKFIKVYKLRTMYPYSEYLQQFVYERYGLQEGGKIKDDPRVNPVGKVCRKMWLDEIPMLWNLLKGDMKLVGVRPLSAHYMSLYPSEFQEYRKNFKPGFVPPFYADLPKTMEEIVASEERYLKSYQRDPIRTDIKYLCQAVYNILIKRARSK